jgi:hypothetical protein
VRPPLVKVDPKTIAVSIEQPGFATPIIVVAENDEDLRCGGAEPASQGLESLLQNLVKKVIFVPARGPPVGQEISTEEESGRMIPLHGREQRTISVLAAVQV